MPDGFTLSAPAVNNGGGVWRSRWYRAKLTLIPPANFSGSVDPSLSAFTLDKGLHHSLENQRQLHRDRQSGGGMPSSPIFKGRRVAPKGM